MEFFESYRLSNNRQSAISNQQSAISNVHAMSDPERLPWRVTPPTFTLDRRVAGSMVDGLERHV
ncbi:MAG: hypothetical protein EOO78_18515 [Oxalobacteraceae bacterium]|nr:MAG: hypothetical protein EOO78_18515 [Oxalobacteraceae bacterium]